MEKIVVLKYGELWLKSKRTRKRFEDALRQHLSFLFPEDKYVFKRERVVVYTQEYNIKRFKFVPGIEYAHVCYKIKADLDYMDNIINEILDKEKITFSSFAVRCTRTGKHDFNSKDVEIKIGAKIKERTNAKVNLTNPEYVLKIEIVDKDAYIVTRTEKCLGGLPYASEGECILRSNNLYLAIETIKRGLYIKNLPTRLRKLYPKLEPNFDQGFEIEIYDYTKEYSDKITSIEKKENRLLLFPLIFLSRDDLKEKTSRYEKELEEVITILS